MMRPSFFLSVLLVTAACSDAGSFGADHAGGTAGREPACDSCVDGGMGGLGGNDDGSALGGDSGAQPGACGPAPIGAVCRRSDGSCEDLQCIAGEWSCAENEQSVPVGSCGAGGTSGEGGTGGSSGSCASPAPVGSTCQRTDGSCTNLQCIASEWKCAAGEMLVPVTPGACQ